MLYNLRKNNAKKGLLPRKTEDLCRFVLTPWDPFNSSSENLRKISRVIQNERDLGSQNAVKLNAEKGLESVEENKS